MDAALSRHIKRAANGNLDAPVFDRGKGLLGQRGSMEERVNATRHFSAHLRRKSSAPCNDDVRTVTSWGQDKMGWLPSSPHGIVICQDDVFVAHRTDKTAK